MPLNFVPRPKVRYTKGFEKYVLNLSALNVTISAIASLCGVSWDTVKDIQKKYLLKKYARPCLKNVTHIGIDEIYSGRKSGFMTVVIDMKTSSVVYIEKGKKAKSLKGFWARKKRYKKPIQSVATDMGQAYICSVKENAPDAQLVIDRFHVIKRFNDKLTAFRRTLQNTVQDKDQAKYLKNTRWLLLSNPENLDSKGKSKLLQALHANQPLSTVYYLKEKLRMLWNCASKKAGEKWLESWIEEAQDSGIVMVQSFINALRKHKDGMLALYDERMSSGKVEGVNNRIKTLNKVAYGYRDREFFELRVKASHEVMYQFHG